MLHALYCKILSLFLVLMIVVNASTRVDLISLDETKDDIVSIKKGSIHVNPFTDFKINLFGSGLNNSLVSFSRVSDERGESCSNHRETKVYSIFSTKTNSTVLTLNFKKPNGGVFYLCTKEGKQSKWIHQGKSSFLSVTVNKKGAELPKWVRFIIVAILMILSGLFSGLNLGLMSLDPNELKIVLKSGTTKQKKYAAKILPARTHGNFLLCTLLLGNTLVNASFTMLLDSLAGSGVVAVASSTMLIVIFGEIVPQSICARYGLAVGSYTIYLTKLFMLLTFPLSFPVSKVLDWILGKELGTVYNKQQLLEMVKLQSDFNDLEQDEVGIISGALEYGRKLVEEIMTPIDDCFLLDEEAILDFQTISDIIKTGHSRIPIYSGERSNIVALLFVKDLAFVDPDDSIPLLSVLKFYNHPVHKVFYNKTLDKMFEEFKQGTTHLSIVLKIHDDGEGDPFYDSIGIITLEDVLEEIIQAEIVDETDVFIDNVSGKRVHRKHHHHHNHDLFLPAAEDVQPKISPQLAFAIYQYLSSAVDAFSSDLMTRAVLKKTIEYPGVIEEMDVDQNHDVYLYKSGVQCDFFSLIIQGRIEVTVGVENIVFEDGPFSVFGVNALLYESGHHFVPDYFVKVTSKIQYLKVTRSLYRSAIRASRMEFENKTPDTYHEYDEIFWSHMNKSMITVRNSIASSKGEIRSRGCSLKSFDNTVTNPPNLTQLVNHNLLNRFSADRSEKESINSISINNNLDEVLMKKKTDKGHQKVIKKGASNSDLRNNERTIKELKQEQLIAEQTVDNCDGNADDESLLDKEKEDSCPDF